MTYPEAIALLETEGLNVVRRPFGIEGFTESAEGRLRFQIGQSSAGGDELSIRREGEGSPIPGGPVRWFHRPSLEELVALLVEAQRRVRTGSSTSLFNALLDLDSR
jgi:hypothetical protein